MHAGPYFEASLTPVHTLTGCGAFHRSVPSGGAANGMPLKMRTPSADVPLICPPSTLIVSDAADVKSDAAPTKAVTEINRFMPASLSPPDDAPHAVSCREG